MTATRRPRTNPLPSQNGVVVTESPNPEPPKTTEERVTELEQTVTRLATALAALLTQQAQPQVQQAILAQLTGGAP